MMGVEGESVLENIVRPTSVTQKGMGRVSWYSRVSVMEYTRFWCRR